MSNRDKNARSRLPSLSPWSTVTLAERDFWILDLDHPRIAERIVGDMDAGIDVYYDRRWAVTDRFCRFLLTEPTWVADRTVLVIGAGVGMETLVIGSLCNRLYINDLAPGALELCVRQLRRNSITNVVCLPGRYETLSLPPVDLIAGCFLVYNRDTATAMRQFLDRCAPPVLLINDNMPILHKLIGETSRPSRFLLPPEDDPCILFS